MLTASPRKIRYRLVPKAAATAATAAEAEAEAETTAAAAAATAATTTTAALAAAAAETSKARSAHAEEFAAPAAAAAAAKSPLGALNATNFGNVDLFQILVGQVNESYKLLGDFAIGRFHVVFPFLG
jgi:hypothetical protein